MLAKRHTASADRPDIRLQPIRRTATLEPGGQRFEIVREARELPHRLVVANVGHRHPVALAADVDARGVQVDRLENLLL